LARGRKKKHFKVVLLEAMGQVSNLPDHIGIRQEKGVGGRVTFRYSRKGIWRATDADEGVVGHITIAQPHPELEGAGGGAWVVKSVEAAKGWGPLLYDIAIEWATKNGNGLAPDRFRVTENAYSVWHYYLTKRGGDVSHKPISNCLQNSAQTWGERLKIPPEETAVAYVYENKNINIIDDLKAERRFKEK